MRPPAARPWRTFLGVIWERETQWRVRARTDYVLVRAAIVACIVLAAVGVVVAFPFDWIVTFTIVFVPIFTFFLFLTKTGPSVIVDWRSQHVVTGSEAFPMADLRGVVLKSELMENSNRGPERYYRSQAWVIDLVRSNGAVQIAVHRGEYTLLRAAQRLAVQLGVPLYDTCGGWRTVTAWNPRDGLPESLVIAYQKEDVAPGEPEAAGERTTSRGAEISWRQRCKSQLNAFLGSIVLLALGTPLAVHSAAQISVGGRMAVGFVAIFAVTLVAALPGVLRFHGLNLVTVGSEAVLLRTSWPFPITNRIPRAALEWVRLSARLTVSKEAKNRTLRWADKPAVTHVCVDFVGKGGRLLRRFRLPEREARWLAERIRLALGAEVIDKKWEGWGDDEDEDEDEDEEEDEK